MRSFRDKVAVVTGAANGIGRAIAERLIAEQMQVMLADVDEPALARTAEHLRGRGGRVASAVTDVADAGSVQDLARLTCNTLGPCDLLCNNAGLPGPMMPIWETSSDAWRRVFDVNVGGMVHGITSFLPDLIDRGQGHVVNMGALVGWMTVPALGIYAASKHAVLALSETLRDELAGTGVGVSVVCPGGVANTRILGGDGVGRRTASPTRAEREDDVSPSAVAEAVMQGVRDKRFLVTTHPRSVVIAAQSRLSMAAAAATTAT